MLMLNFSKRFFNQGKRLLYHQATNNGQISDTKQNLVILHGIMGYGGLYRHLATNPKTAEKYNSSLIDLRNHGKSFWHQHMSVQQMAHDVMVWLEQQNFKKRNVTMVGHSLGGRVLISLTQQFPRLSDIIKKIVIVDAAPHSYEGFPFVAKSMEFIQKLIRVDFAKSNPEILSYVKSICTNDIQESLVKLNLDLQNRRFVYNIDVIRKDYLKLCSYECKSLDWSGDVYVIKALRAGYVIDRSKQQFMRLYNKNLKEIQDVDCYHNVHVERPFSIIKAIHK